MSLNRRRSLNWAAIMNRSTSSRFVRTSTENHSKFAEKVTISAQTQNRETGGHMIVACADIGLNIGHHRRPVAPPLLPGWPAAASPICTTPWCFAITPPTSLVPSFWPALWAIKVLRDIPLPLFAATEDRIWSRNRRMGVRRFHVAIPSADWSMF
jgi:hypothetical protein